MMRIIFAHGNLTFGPDENHFAHTNILLKQDHYSPIHGSE